MYIFYFTFRIFRFVYDVVFLNLIWIKRLVQLMTDRTASTHSL